MVHENSHYFLLLYSMGIMRLVCGSHDAGECWNRGLGHPVDPKNPPFGFSVWRSREKMAHGREMA